MDTLFYYTKYFKSLFSNTLTRSTIKKIGDKIKFNTARTNFPFCNLNTIPKITLVIGMIAKINEMMCGCFKYALFVFAAIRTSVYFYNSIVIKKALNFKYLMLFL